MGLLIYPGNRCAEGAPLVECVPLNFNTVTYTITGATRAYWTQSSLPTQQNDIPLTDGSAEGTLSADSLDVYEICAEFCGTCARSCCFFECDGGPETESCECVEEGTLTKRDILNYNVSVITDTSGSFDSVGVDARLPDCGSVDCANVDGTHIFQCKVYSYAIEHVFICTAQFDGMGDYYDFYNYMHIEHQIIPGDLIISIEHGMVAYTAGSTPPTNVKPEDAANYGGAIYRFWRVQYRFDAETVDTTNPCTDGPNPALRLCSVGDGIVNVINDETFRLGGCNKPTITLNSIGLG